jgi:hypothetical protein
MTEQLKGEESTNKNWFDKLAEKRGIKFKEIETPKDFVRVIFPRNPPGFADGSDPNERKS